MRVATSQFYDFSNAMMGRHQADLIKLQQQISSGKRLHVAAEDPVAMGKLLRGRDADVQNDQYALNRGTAADRLRFTELGLNSLSNVVQRGKEIALAVNKASLSETERQAYLSELQVQYDELLTVANRVDGQGVALFGGLRGTAPYALQPVVPAPVPPSTAPANVVNYLGNDTVPTIEVDNGQHMQTGVSGQQAFGPDTPAGGQQSVFRTYETLIAALTPPLTDNASRDVLLAQMDAVIGDLDNNYQTVLNMQVLVGTRQAQLDVLNTSGDAHGDQLKAMVSELESVDAGSAISLFAQQQAALQAAQQTFISMQGLSLFQYL